MAKSPLDRIKKQNQWLFDLTKVEGHALSMVKPIDLTNCDPEILVCDTALKQALFDYWRVVLSSEPQTSSYAGGGRQMAVIVRDRISGGFMGVIALSDLRTMWRSIMAHFEWDQHPDMKQAHQHQIMMLRRCIPIYEFGQMTGGKLLALLATSRDLMRVLELRYSYQFLYFGLFTLHGRSSQYNRLEQRGLGLVTVDERGRGFYGMELRKKGRQHMIDSTPFGKASTFTVAEQVTYWKDRWLTARTQSTGNSPIITPDPARYRLSDLMSSRRLTLAHLDRDPEHGTESEEADDETSGQ